MADICTFGTYAKLFILDLGINWGMAIPAIVFKTERYYDLTGAITNITLAVASYALSPKQSTRQLVQSFMAAVWAARLGLFLFRRILKDGHDKRFKEAKQKPIMMFVFWSIQGLVKPSTCIYIILCASTYSLNLSVVLHHPPADDYAQ